MHCTSPGDILSTTKSIPATTTVCHHNKMLNDFIDKHKINKEDDNYQLQQFMPGMVIKGTLSSSDLDQRTYDDPCDLMEEWSSPAHLPRSRSWLCCPNAIKTPKNSEPKLNRGLSCQYSSLITEAPRPHYDSVFKHFFF